MTLSKHYTEDRKFREDIIAEIGGEGTVVYDIVKFDTKRQRWFKHEITDNGVMIVKPAEDENFIITKLVLRPSRLRQYWENAPKEIVDKTVSYSRNRKTK